MIFLFLFLPFLFSLFSFSLIFLFPFLSFIFFSLAGSKRFGLDFLFLLSASNSLEHICLCLLFLNLFFFLLLYYYLIPQIKKGELGPQLSEDVVGQDHNDAFSTRHMLQMVSSWNFDFASIYMSLILLMVVRYSQR